MEKNDVQSDEAIALALLRDEEEELQLRYLSKNPMSAGDIGNRNFVGDKSTSKISIEADYMPVSDSTIFRLIEEDLKSKKNLNTQINKNTPYLVHKPVWELENSDSNKRNQCSVNPPNILRPQKNIMEEKKIRPYIWSRPQKNTVEENKIRPSIGLRRRQRNNFEGNETYEELLKLDEENYNEGNGLKKEDLERLPTYDFSPKYNLKNCSICLGNFKLGEILCILPCMHIFHEDCIKNWLSRKKKCSVCLIDVAFN
jgi:Ring finger domain